MRSIGPSSAKFESRITGIRLRVDQGRELRRLAGDGRGAISTLLRQILDEGLERRGVSGARDPRDVSTESMSTTSADHRAKEELSAEPEREEVTREAGETESDSVPQQYEWAGQLPEGPFCETVMNLLEQGPCAESEIHAHVGVSKGDNLLFDLLYEDLDSLVRAGLIRFDPEYQQHGEKTEGIYYLPRDGE